MAQIKIDKNVKLGRGATATIYKASYDGDIYAAKVYNDKNRFHKAKIEAMLSNPPSNILVRFADEVFPQLAWPQKIFRLDNGQTHGYLMPLIDLEESFPLDYFYDPILFGKLNAPEESALSYKVEIARNLASIIADLHKHGHFFIDLKPQNIRVFRHTHVVTLLDCDGFSIVGNTDKRYPADLISSDYISPEAYKYRMSPKDLGVEQDLYALAVILFQILNNGTHPFQGIIQDDSIEAATNDEKASLGLYPHGLERDSRILPRQQSIHELWPTSMRKLFDRAFVGDEKNRPSASEWSEHFDQLLKDKVLVRCEKHPLNIAHIRFKLKECPRCYLDDLASKPKKATHTKTTPNKASISQPQPQYTQSTTKTHPIYPKTEDSSWFMHLVVMVALGYILVVGVRSCSNDKPEQTAYSQTRPEISKKEIQKDQNTKYQPTLVPSKKEDCLTLTCDYEVVAPANNNKSANNHDVGTSKSTATKIDSKNTPSPQKPADADKNLKKWATNNPWFNTEKEMRDYALEVHNQLAANSKVSVGSKEYYDLIDTAMHQRYKTYFDNLEIEKIKTAKNQYEAGWKFMVGDGIKQDLKEAVKWFTVSAESGNPDAQSVLALMYEKGNGVKPDIKKAAYWYGRAANQGDVDAINWVKAHSKK